MTGEPVGTTVTASDTAPGSEPPLAGIRVVEVGGTLAAAYAGRLLADLGADVTAVQPFGGDVTWRKGPRLGPSGPGAFGAYLHAGKRAVAAAPGDESIRRLAVGADVVVVDLGGSLVDADWANTVAESSPSTIVVMLSDFGSTGPWAQRPGGDLVVMALAGMLSIMSTNPLEGPLRPIRYRTELSQVFAACNGVLATLGALVARLGHGAGDLIDVSAMEAVVGSTATALPAWTYNGTLVEPGGRRGVCPWAIYDGIDGRFLVQITEDSQWRLLVKLMGDPEWGHLEMFATTADRIEQMESVEALVASALAEFEVDDFLQRAHEAGVPACRVNTPLDTLAWPQLRARGFFREFEVAGHGRFEAPGAPARFDGATIGSDPTAVPPTAFAPITDLIGSDTPEDVPTRLPMNEIDPVERRAPLDGIRVVDLTWVWAGPFAAMMLAHLGAEVIKVESEARPDVTRILGPFADEVPGLDRSGFFNQFNLGKQSVRVDPTTTEGKRVLADLIATADLVVDNMRPGALARMGFPPERLDELSPGIVATSMTGFGLTGPEADHQAYGSLIDATSGQVAATGMPGGGWTEVPMSLPDPCSGLHAAIAMVAALYRRRATGSGGSVECSMVESWIAGLSSAVLHAAVTGQDPPLVGCRDETMSPHGVFRCDGDYEWIALAVRDDEEFSTLLDCIGAADHPQASRWSDLESRRRDEDVIERLVESWTSQRTAEDVERIWTGAGLAAARVRRMDEVARCAHLEARGYFAELDHASVGVRRLGGTAWTCTRAAVGPFRSAPTFGEHTDAVLSSIGYDADERARLRSDGILR